MTRIVPPYETLHVEFKSDRKKLSDNDLLEAVVCLANTEGGELWLGVEDDGTVTGLHPEHALLDGLAGMIASRTSPMLTVGVETVQAEGRTVVRITVPKAASSTATTGGVYLRRRLKSDGKPECAPMLPHDIASRATSFGQLDLSAQPVPSARPEDLDPLWNGNGCASAWNAMAATRCRWNWTTRHWMARWV
jgi:ATP-dependent DNA helicase RecG